MNIDDFWLSDDKLLELSRQDPSTEYGKQLLPKWKERFVDPQPSELYRGYGIVLWALWKQMREGMSKREIQRVIDGIHDSRMASMVYVRGTDLDAGATLAAANAWEATEAGTAAGQLPGAYESELIYVAKLFVAARSREGKPVEVQPPKTPETSNVPQPPSPEAVRKTRRSIAAGVLGVTGLLSYSTYPGAAIICFLAAGFFFFAKQPADQILDKLLSPPRDFFPPGKQEP